MTERRSFLSGTAFSLLLFLPCGLDSSHKMSRGCRGELLHGSAKPLETVLDRSFVVNKPSYRRACILSCHNNAMARIAIVGVGAIGAVIAALLQSLEQHELILCTRRPLPHLNVETPEGGININYTNATAPSQAELVDWVIVATKTYDAPGAAEPGSNISANKVRPSQSFRTGWSIANALPPMRQRSR
jgi:hypothetical protein